MPSTLYQRIYELVAQVPPGRVVTYGQIALALGYPRAGRTIGWAMRSCPPGVPWHRVVKAGGQIGLRDPNGQSLQRALLEEEGIVFDQHGRIDLQVYGWAGI